MIAPEGPDNRGTSPRPGPEEIQRDIEHTRAQLGETAGALAHKLDPKAQTKERLDRARERPALTIGVAAGVVALVVVAVLWRRNG
jgi:hypothetical protein